MTLQADPPTPRNRRRRARSFDPGNSDVASADVVGARAHGSAWARLADRLTGERMLVYVFRFMLAAAIVTLALDLRDLWQREAMETVRPGDVLPAPLRQPVRAPSTRSPPPNDITTDPKFLSSAMTMELGAGGKLALVGTIDPGAADRLADELGARGEYVESVTLNSPGGSVHDAIAMAEALRTLGKPVRVLSGSLCASSCPIVLSGGETREVSARASVGVHQIFSAEDTQFDPRFDGMAEGQRTTARIGRHLEAMGVDPLLWLHALETPKDALYYLSPEELTRYRLATVLLDPEAAPPVPTMRERVEGD